MAPVSIKLRRGPAQYFHWCPGCDEMHALPDGWTFNGNLDQPTFSPSFLHSGHVTAKVNGEWTGEWARDAQGAPVPFVCHYILTDGILNFCADSTHALAGEAVDLPPLPPRLVDSDG